MGASLITGVVLAICLSSVVALTLVQQCTCNFSSAPGSSWKPSKLSCSPRKNIMTIMSSCCIDAESYTAESRFILESIIFPTSSSSALVSMTCLHIFERLIKVVIPAWTNNPQCCYLCWKTVLLIHRSFLFLCTIYIPSLVFPHLPALNC